MFQQVAGVVVAQTRGETNLSLKPSFEIMNTLDQSGVGRSAIRQVKDTRCDQPRCVAMDASDSHKG